MVKDGERKAYCFRGGTQGVCFRAGFFMRALIASITILSLLLVSCSGGTSENGDAKESETKAAKTISISRTELDGKIGAKDGFLIYVGRPSCPDCVEFEPKLEKMLSKGTNQDLYYFNSDVEKVSERKEMKKYVSSFGIEEIPAILDIKNGEVIRVYDCQKNSDILEVEKVLKKGV